MSGLVGVIPARYASSRLPGKPLREICGKPMIWHVYTRAAKAKMISRLTVATDDERIADAVRAFGGEAVMTDASCSTGTDRVAQAVRGLACEDVVNIQGDEPLVSPELIDEIAAAHMAEKNRLMTTACHLLSTEEEYRDIGVVKTAMDINGYALYFSRSLIPYPQKKELFAAYEHIGIYAYTYDFLQKFVELAPTPLSETESLEQLRALEHGYKIKVIVAKTKYDALSVDTEEDIAKVEAKMRL